MVQVLIELVLKYQIPYSPSSNNRYLIQGCSMKGSNTFLGFSKKSAFSKTFDLEHKHVRETIKSLYFLDTPCVSSVEVVAVEEDVWFKYCQLQSWEYNNTVNIWWPGGEMFPHLVLIVYLH